MSDMSALERNIREANDRAVEFRGRENIDWFEVNRMEAAMRAVGLRHGLAGEMALGLWLKGQRFTFELVSIEVRG